MVRNSFDVQAASRSSSAYPFFLWKDVRPVLFLFLTGGFSKFKLPNTGNNYRLRDIWSKINIDNVQAILFNVPHDIHICTYICQQLTISYRAH